MDGARGAGYLGATDADGAAVLSGSWRRDRGSRLAGTGELTTDARRELETAFAARLAVLAGLPAPVELEQQGPARIRLDRAGLPTVLRLRWRARRSDDAGARPGRYELLLRRAR